MTAPKPLSPAAQKVLDAAMGQPEFATIAVCTSAALRAVADRLTDLIGDINHPKFMEGIESSAGYIERIAAELDPQGEGEG